MTDKKPTEQVPADQQVPPSAASVAEMAQQLQAQFDAMMRGHKAKTMAALLRNWGK